MYSRIDIPSSSILTQFAETNNKSEKDTHFKLTLKDFVWGIRYYNIVIL